eukprot:366142-Chlamydomonas_euryale.AAC.13
MRDDATRGTARGAPHAACGGAAKSQIPKREYAAPTRRRQRCRRRWQGRSESSAKGNWQRRGLNVFVLQPVEAEQAAAALAALCMHARAHGGGTHVDRPLVRPQLRRQRSAQAAALHGCAAGCCGCCRRALCPLSGRRAHCQQLLRAAFAHRASGRGRGDRALSETRKASCRG